MHILWTLVIGFVAGLIAKLAMPGLAPSIGRINRHTLTLVGAALLEPNQCVVPGR